MSSVYEEMARAFAIFASYPDPDDNASVNAEHDQLWAGPAPAIVSPEHLAELEAMRWTPDDEGCTFHRFT